LIFRRRGFKITCKKNPGRPAGRDGSKQNKDQINAMVPDIGDEAYIGPGFMDPRYTLTLLKGQQCVFLSTALVPGNPITTMLTLDQIKEIGKLVASRM
jgi:hypothetical protein